METVDTRSTSKYTAEVSDIVIRQSDRVRLIFRPTIVQNASDPIACVNGVFIYQRKGKSDAWEDVDAKSLSTLKKGEEYRLSIHSEELLRLMQSLRALYQLHRREGVPQGRHQYVKVERSLARLLQLNEPDLNDFLSQHSADAFTSLRRVAGWLANSPVAARRMLNEGALPHLNALVGIANLKAFLGEWQDNRTNADEEFWQALFERHTFALSQLLAYPVVVIHDKPYLGGKTLNNKHGKYSDFLARIPSSGGAVLVEIKTPMTALVGAMYRDEVYPPSSDLSGAIAQVLTQRDTFMHQFYAITHDDPAWLGVEPKCVVIAGANIEALSSSQKRCFERFRERLSGVTVVTFDELFSRVSGLIDLLEAVEHVEPHVFHTNEGRVNDR